MAVIEASTLVVRRAGRAILNRASLRAASGDFIVVIGPNGAGKSTLLKVMAGLMKPDAGTVTLDGTSIHQLPQRQLARRRAYLPQNPRCEWPISVERLVALGLTPSLPAFGGLPASFVEPIRAALEAFDLVDRREQPVTTLSGGELTRAMLARALVGDPDVLIVDEPIAGLDPKHTLDTAQRLQSLALAGKVVIASMHDLTIAGRYANRIYALDQGQTRGDGPSATTLTADLIRSVFDVTACVTGARERLSVDYLSTRANVPSQQSTE